MPEPFVFDGRPLRVALVHDWLTGMRGGEKVLEAVAELFPEAPIYTLFHFPGSVSGALESHPIRTSTLQNRWSERLLRKNYRYLLPFFPAAIEDFDLTPFDLILSTSHCVAKGVLPGPDALHFCYCHSPIRYAWDQEHQYFPERRGLTARLRSLALSELRVWDVASSHRVDHFWANSSFVARRIRRFYGRSAEVLHPPVDVETFGNLRETPGNHADSAYKIENGFALAVSALVPYKKLDLAIQACELRGIELRIVGTGPEQSRLEKLCRGKTQLLGRVDEETLRRLYREAAFFLQPGTEDFGIATVEALAAGSPVVALRQGGVMDIVDDGVHGVLYDPPEKDSEVASIVAAIDKLRQIRFNLLELERRAAQFSKGRFRRRLEDSLREQVGNRSRGSAPPMERT